MSLEVTLFEAQRLLHFERHRNSKDKHCPFCIVVDLAAGTYRANTNNPFAVAILSGEAKLAYQMVNGGKTNA